MRLAILVLLFTFASTALAEHNKLTPEQIADGWISLFDGDTLFGWENTSDIDWHVEDGEIRATTGKVGLLATTAEFADYQLHVEFKAGEKTNSGLFLRTPKVPKDPAKDCYEVNIAPFDNPYPTGSIVGRQKFPPDDDDREIPWTAYPPQLAEGAKVRPLEPSDGEWHAFDVSVKEKKITVRLDDLPIIDYVDEQPVLRGHIGLQHNKGEIAFRNVRLKPLNNKPIFNGKDLTGWNTDKAEASEFKVTPDGELQVLNGRGQIESDASFCDFVLQLECFVNGDALNSGIFFRCIPRDFMMGYECQIQNGVKDGDPTQPVDCGTGGFFRRQNARRIVANDREWFAMTLVADGPHMAAWVNGYPVSDWTDTRKPNENPRRGLRLEPGTLAIQGHDPTTDLRFRKLQIAELPTAEE
ncbi:MAG: DUF1080 domain-containing protein [Planctomycetota bacterium]